MTKRISFVARVALTTALASAACLSGVSQAQAASEELKCQDAIAVSARNYFKDRFSAVSKCEGARISGKIDIATDCRPGSVTDAATAAKLDKAASKLSGKITGKCSDSVAPNVRLGLPCGTAAAASDIVECIVNDAHGANADLLIESAYDSTGLVEDSGVFKCQATIAKEAQAYAKARMTALRGCGKQVTSGKQSECPDAKTRAKLAKSLDKFTGKVLGACSDEQVLDAALDFGFPCESFEFTTFQRTGATNNNAIPAAERLTRCIAAAAAGDADLGANTAYPLPDAAPFSFGVSAGDATETAFIAWTRTDGPGAVTLDVASDPDFASIVKTVSGLTPNAAGDNTVKVDVTGMTAATQYYYRFTQGDGTSRVGRVRTAPTANSTAPFRFSWTGDANAYFKPYTVLQGLVEDAPDLFLFIGDTIYGDDERSGTGVATVRSEYHTKYRENLSDHSLRDALAVAGSASIWDDHEVTNDFYGTDPAIQAQMLQGSLAFRDFMPLRENTDDPLQLYRSLRWGQAAEFFLIDDRQYRSSQAYITEPACGSVGALETLPNATCQAELDNPSRTYLGAAQKQWLKDGLQNSTAKFKFIMNGPLISTLIFVPYDRWDGYTAERQEMIDFIKDNDIRNVIFLSTDIHAAIVNDAVGGTDSPVIRELVSGAIGMDPIFRELPATVAGLVPQLPSIFTTISYFDIDRFNYATVDVTTSNATVTYRDTTGGVLTTFVIPAE